MGAQCNEEEERRVKLNVGRSKNENLTGKCVGTFDNPRGSGTVNLRVSEASRDELQVYARMPDR